MAMNAVPLADALPWDSASTGGRTVLVCDSASTSGRFLLHTMASQVLSSPARSPSSSSSAAAAMRGRGDAAADSAGGGRVLWLSCGAATDRQVGSALKKIGCDNAAATSAALRVPSSSSSDRARPTRPLEVIQVASEVATMLLADQTTNTEGMETAASEIDDYPKKLYTRIKSWLNQNQNQSERHRRRRNDLIVVDDATLLASFFGERTAYFFLHKLHATTRRTGGCLTILCSHDADQERSISEAAGEDASGSVNVNVSGKRGDWIGAGGDVSVEEGAAALRRPSWERGVVELADGVVDVVPLQSGFSREAHGRLVFTERKGGLGWQDQDHGARQSAVPTASRTSGFLTTVVNYVCEDAAVKAFRLRAVS